MPINLPNNPTIAAGFIARKLLGRKKLLVSIGCWIVAIVLILFYLVPQVGKTIEAYRTLGTSTRELKSLQEKLSFVKSFQGDAFKKQESMVEAILPSSKPLLPLLNTLNQLSSSQQVSITGIELSPGSISTDSSQVARSGKELEDLPVNLVVQGNIFNVNAFLDALNNATPILEISDISLDPVNRTQEASASGSLYNGKIGLVSYFAPLSLKTSAGQTLPTLSASDQTFIKELEQFVIYKTAVLPTTQENKVDLFTY